MGKIDMVKWLKTTDISYSEISRTTGISRNTLYSWIASNAEIRDSNYNKIAKHYESYFTQKEKMDMDTSHVGLLEDKVRSLDLENTMLKKQLNDKQAESHEFENVRYDYMANIKLSYKGFKVYRTVLDVNNIELQSEKLGYTEDELTELWEINQKINLSHIKMNKIIDNDTIDEMENKAKTLPYIFNALKDMIGNHYIPVPIIYIHKNGTRVPAISYNYVKWNKMEVVAKVKFLAV